MCITFLPGMRNMGRHSYFQPKNTTNTSSYSILSISYIYHILNLIYYLIPIITKPHNKAPIIFPKKISNKNFLAPKFNIDNFFTEKKKSKFEFYWIQFKSPTKKFK